MTLFHSFLLYSTQALISSALPWVVVVELIKKTESGRCEGGASVNRPSSVEPKVGATFSTAGLYKQIALVLNTRGFISKLL